MPVEQKQVQINSYEDLHLKTYILYLPLDLQTNVRLRNPDSLGKAMGLVIEEENFLYILSRSNSLQILMNIDLQPIDYHRFPSNKVTHKTISNPQLEPHQVQIHKITFFRELYSPSIDLKILLIPLNLILTSHPPLTRIILIDPRLTVTSIDPVLVKVSVREIFTFII